jgi:hypothetical protein
VQPYGDAEFWSGRFGMSWKIVAVSAAAISALGLLAKPGEADDYGPAIAVSPPQVSMPAQVDMPPAISTDTSIPQVDTGAPAPETPQAAPAEAAPEPAAPADSSQ